MSSPNTMEITPVESEEIEIEKIGSDTSESYKSAISESETVSDSEIETIGLNVEDNYVELDRDLQKRLLAIIARGPEKTRGGSTSADLKIEKEENESSEDVQNISINGKVHIKIIK